MKSSEKRWLLIAVTTTLSIWGVTILAASKSHAQCTTCNGSFLTEKYTTALPNWTSVTSTCAGAVTVGGFPGRVRFTNAQSGRSKRVWRNIPTLNYDDWTAEAEVRVTGNNAPAMDIIAFTSGNLDPWYNAIGPGCGSGPYTPTNQDGIVAYLSSGPAPPTPSNPTSAACCPSPATLGYPWFFAARAKQGTTFLPPSSPIMLPPLLGITYYVRLQRTWHSQGMISVFDDAAMTKHLPDSPQCFEISPTITTLNVLQHGVPPQGSLFRVVSATIDNLRVCSGNTCPLTLTPSFTADPDYCPDTGPPITVNGSATTGMPSDEINHEWLITECDASGKTTFNPATTWSQWYPGLAGPYAFPANLYGVNGGFIKCGKYYLVRLGVQNCGNRFVSTSHVIRIKCNYPC